MKAFSIFAGMFLLLAVCQPRQNTVTHVETDPAIRYGSLTMELKPRYGSAALKKVNEIHESIARIHPE